MSFASLGLCDPILRAVSEQGYSAPTPIQSRVVPAVLEGRDLMAAAQTGTGKTAGFTLPILERLAPGAPAGANRVRALVLTPTRELAAQVGESVRTYGKYLRLSSTVVFGGVKINPQMMSLRRGVDVLVATPGRLLDLYQQNAVKFDQLEVLVLDEADRMLDMGFIHDIRRILALLPANRQNLMFSATFSDDIRRLARSLTRDPLEVSVTPPNTTVAAVEQWLCPVDKSRKPALLTQLIRDNNWYQVLVFTRTKHGANRLTKYLDSQAISALAIHGNKSQGARTRALAEFKGGNTQVLVATDIAARGLDIDQLPHVVNFDLPSVPEDYVHRIGRTGRAGATGEAVSLVSADEIKQLADIERLIRKRLERRVVPGFEPQERVPEPRSIEPRAEAGPARRQAGSKGPAASANGHRRPQAARQGARAGNPQQRDRSRRGSAPQV